MKQTWMAGALALALLMAGCGPAGGPTATPQGATSTPTAAPASGEKLTVMTHDSFQVSKDVVAAFETAHNAQVQFFKAGDAGTMLNKAILSKDNPLADVMYGVDNTFLSRALTAGLFVPYDSPALASIPSQFKLDPQNRELPVDYGDVCLNYDKAYFKQHNLAPPASLEDLAKPDYKSLTIVENPATSSPGLAFLLATVGHFGPDKYLDYWKSLVANGVLVDNDWETAYYTDFSTHGGARPIVVSYASSPPAEVYYATTPISEPPIGVVTGNTSCFRQIEFVGILQGTQHMKLAQQWVDFMLSTTFQEDMPLNMFVFPVNPVSKLPPVFTQWAVIPSQTAQVSPDQIAQNRDAWIQAWSQVVLK